MGRLGLSCYAQMIGAATLLAGCGGSQPMIGAPPDNADMSPFALKTCATSPPQYEWIFKGACQIFYVTSSGGQFSLGEYQGITVQGLIGKNTAKGTVKIALADAIDANGDIKPYKGKSFPQYKAKGITYFYASAINQSWQVFKPIVVRGKPIVVRGKPIVVRGKPVFQYMVTNAKGFGDATICGAAALGFNSEGKRSWIPLPTTDKVKGQTVTIRQFVAPMGFELPPKIPLYFATNCYKR